MYNYNLLLLLLLLFCTKVNSLLNAIFLECSNIRLHSLRILLLGSPECWCICIHIFEDLGEAESILYLLSLFYHICLNTICAMLGSLQTPSLLVKLDYCVHATGASARQGAALEIAGSYTTWKCGWGIKDQICLATKSMWWVCDSLIFQLISLYA